MIGVDKTATESQLTLEEDVRLTDGTKELRLPITENGPWQDLEPSVVQSKYERRDSDREVVVKMGFRVIMQKHINELVRRLSKSRAWQAAFVCTLVSSVTLIWFTATYRFVLLDGVYEDLALRGQLETELFSKNREWSEERMKALGESVRRADQRRVFLDYSTLASWLTDERDVAAAMDLEFSYVLEKTQTSRMAHVDEVVANILVKVPDSHDSLAYIDLMRFLREMIKTPWYVEIVDSTIDGGERGATQLNAQLRIWVHDRVDSGA